MAVGRDFVSGRALSSVAASNFMQSVLLSAIVGGCVLVGVGVGADCLMMAATIFVRHTWSSVSISAGVKLSALTWWLSLCPTMLSHAKKRPSCVFTPCLPANSRRIGQALVGVSALSIRRGVRFVGIKQMLLVLPVFVLLVLTTAVVDVLQASSKSLIAGVITLSIWNHFGYT